MTVEQNIILLELLFYYSKHGEGSFHIVIGDGNIEHNFIEFCLKDARTNNDEDGIKLGEFLLTQEVSDIEIAYDKFYELI